MILGDDTGDDAEPTGPAVSALGLGCMGMSDLYGPADATESVATIRAALDAGVTLLDTGDFYGMGHNELLIREALARARPRDGVLISVKFGALRDPDGGWAGLDGRPAAVKNFLAYTLRRLGTDHVDVYRPARLDPDVPIEETIGAIAELVQAGHVRHVGLSEVGAGDDPPRRCGASDRRPADRVLAALARDRGRDPARVPRARDRRDRVRRALARPALRATGRPGASSTPATSAPTARASRAATSIATSRWSRRCAASPTRSGASVAQVAIAWVLAQGEDVVPLVGARRRERLHEALGALELELSPAETASASRPPCRPAPRRASATPLRPWASSTVSGRSAGL